MLDFRLRVFYTVAKLLNFTKAAATLQISQPAVTKHIKELEQSYKVILFDRQPNALALTDAGKLLYKHAMAIMEQYDLLDFDIEALNNKITGNLRIAATSTIAQYVLPQILASFNERMPNVSIHLKNDNSANVRQLLLSKEIDIGFTEKKADEDSLQYNPYLKDEIILACSKRNNVLQKTNLSIDDLYKLPFAVYENGSETYAIISEQLKVAGVSLNRLHTNVHFDNIESIKLFLIYSNHFTFLSTQAIAQELASNSLRAIFVDGLNITRDFYVARRNTQPGPIIASFLKFIKADLQ
jgi:LysR family transcriptional regulator, transcriptional activator of the cysJI operon